MPVRIFFADPNTKTVENFEKKLSGTGYEVVSTSNGNEVVRTINVNNVPHLIVLHSDLQGESTLKICQDLRKEKRTVNVPILIMKEKGLDVKPYQEINIRQFMEATSDLDEILQKIKLILQSLRQRQGVQAKPKITPGVIVGILVVALCVFVLIFMVFVPLFSGSK